MKYPTLATIFFCGGLMMTAEAQVIPTFERLPNNPIIRPAMLPGDDGENINGPSIIEVPAWVKNPLGQYYLYFAHHAGSYIRLAYADDVAGPWSVHEAGTLRVEDTICNDITESSYATYRHVASPDIQVDDRSQTIRMYFHCPVYIAGPKERNDSYKQVTLVATSDDGLEFTAGTEPLGNSYFRVFEYDGWYYALGMPGIIYRSRDGLTDFEQGPTLFNDNMRHSAVKVIGTRLSVFYTVVGESPERILLSEIDMSGDWMTWSESEPVVFLEPEEDWEGGALPTEPSVRGFSMAPVRQLRDPALFESNGKEYLLYSVAGESGIALALIDFQ